jgi:hypothetical protein
MQQLLVYFWRMCLLRSSPEQAPVSNQFILFVFTAYVMSSSCLLVVAGSEIRIFRTLSLVLSGITIQLGCTWALLAFKSVTNRFRATLTSLLGTNSMLVIMLIPLNFVLQYSENDLILILVQFTYWMFFFWWIAIAGYIFHKATNISLFQGSTLAFTIEIITLVTTSMILPTEAIN